MYGKDYGGYGYRYQYEGVKDKFSPYQLPSYQAKCEKCESTEQAITEQLIASNSWTRSLKAMISVGQTNVLKIKRKKKIENNLLSLQVSTTSSKVKVFVYVNPSTPRSDQHVPSPHNIHTLPTKQVKRIFKLISQKLLSGSNTKFLYLINKEMTSS